MYLQESEHKMARFVVAVVDDDPLALRLMDMVLTRAGYQPLLCADANDACAVIRQGKADLVILDLQMGRDPEAGWTILSRLRADPATTQLPAIMCTANSEWLREQARRLAAQGCDALGKPFDIDGLVARIGDLIRRQPA